MIAIIPLAGPDFESADGSLKALMNVEGSPLLRRALESRSWWRSGDVSADRMVFVLRDTDASRNFARDYLGTWYPGSKSLFLNAPTGGAALSALAGVALAAHERSPVCIDLADILFDDASASAQLFATRPRAGGVGLWFPSDNPAYSYFEMATAGLITRVREKAVISSHASAGVYLFRSPSIYLSAVAHSIDHREELSHRGLFFVAPTLNGVVAAEWDVYGVQVNNVRDVKVAPPTSALKI